MKWHDDAVRMYLLGYTKREVAFLLKKPISSVATVLWSYGATRQPRKKRERIELPIRLGDDPLLKRLRAL